MFIKIKKNPITSLGAAFLLGVFVVSCATVEKPKKGEAKGFLSDYSMLREYGDPNLPPKMYINKEADWASYDKMIIEPMTIWRSPGSSIEDVPEEELKAISAMFNEAFRREMARDYRLIEQPGGLIRRTKPGTLKISYALVEAEDSNKVMDTISTILPIGIVISGGKRLATGTHAFVGRATFEGKIIDAKTGKKLFAFVSRRAGGKGFKKKYESFGHVKAMADVSAETARGLLENNRKGRFPTPK